MSDILTVDGLSYSYRRSRALHDVDLALERGTTVLLGPNGAGKSTLLRLLGGIEPPQRGRLRVNDAVVGSRDLPWKSYRRRVAWLPQQTAPIPSLTAREQVAFTAWLKGETKSRALASADPALDRVGLLDLRDMRADRLSGGQLRRVGIAGALAHGASILLLDEPTAGLDPVQRARFREIVSELAEERTLMIASHDTDELAVAARRILVLAGGRVRFSGPPDAFTAGVEGSRKIEEAYIRHVGEHEK